MYHLQEMKTCILFEHTIQLWHLDIGLIDILWSLVVNLKMSPHEKMKKHCTKFHAFITKCT